MVAVLSRSIGPLFTETAGVSPAFVECHIVKVDGFKIYLSERVA